MLTTSVILVESATAFRDDRSASSGSNCSVSLKLKVVEIVGATETENINVFCSIPAALWVWHPYGQVPHCCKSRSVLSILMSVWLKTSKRCGICLLWLEPLVMLAQYCFFFNLPHWVLDVAPSPPVLGIVPGQRSHQSWWNNIVMEVLLCCAMLFGSKKLWFWPKVLPFWALTLLTSDW